MSLESICTQCNKIYDDPRLLPCLHSFCKTCLEDMVKKVNTTNIIVCPICRETTAVPDQGVYGITPNIHLEHLAKMAKYEGLMKREVPPPCDECTREPHLPVISFCCTCESFLCKECHSQHLLSRKLTLNHKTLQLRDANKVQAKLREYLMFPTIACPIHNKEEITLFCDTCKVLICTQCALTKHCGHNMVELNTFVANEKREVCNSIRDMSDTVNRLDSLLGNAKGVVESIQSRERSVACDVKKLFMELHRLLEERESALLKQCSGLVHNKISTLNVQMDHISALKDAIITCTTFVKSSDIFNIAEFVSVISTLHTRICDLRVKVKQTSLDLSEDDVVNFTADVSTIINSFAALGSIFASKPRDYSNMQVPILSMKTSNAYHMAIHRSGDLVVANHIGDCIEIYDTNGFKKSSFGTAGTMPGQFQHPLGVCVVGDTIYVVEFNGGRCQKMTIKGEFLSEIGAGQLKNAWGCAVSKNGVLYVAEEGSNQVQSFAPDGSPLKAVCNCPLIYSPRDVALDKQGKIHVACCGSKSVKVFDSSGGFLLKYGDGYLTEPSGVAVDNLGYCFVADWGGKSLHIFDQAGRHVHKVVYDGCISGVAIDHNNHVYVVNHSSQIIYKY